MYWQRKRKETVEPRCQKLHICNTQCDARNTEHWIFMDAFMQSLVRLQSAAEHSKLLILSPKCKEICPVLVNVKLPLHMPWRRTGKSEIRLPPFFTSAPGGSEWRASHPGCFTPKERDFGYHRLGSWVDPQDRSGHFEKEISLLHLPLFEPWIFWPVTYSLHCATWFFLSLYLWRCVTSMSFSSILWDSLKTAVIQDAEVLTLCV